MSAETKTQLRIPPHFAEGERAIIGGLLIDNDALPKALSILVEEDFYREAHRLIFAAVTELFNRGEPVDWVTLTSQLQKTGCLDRVGGPAYLTELIDAVASAANIVHYATVVKEKALLRRLISASTEIVTKCYEVESGIDEFLDEAEQLIFQVGESRVQSGFIHIKDLMTAGIKTVETLYEKKEHVTGVPSGFKDLDQLTAGFQASDLIVVAGRPSMGKTSLALNIATYAAIETRTPTAIFSLEMSKEQIALRILCSKARVNLKNLRTGHLSRDEWPRLTGAAGLISEAPLFVDDTPAINTLELRAKARRLKKEKGLGLVVVDYLQLMRGATRSDSREKEISEISRSLKALAKELSAPVVALSQLNRKVEERPNKRPQLADLRESGAIEQDADVIIFIYRDEVYNKSEDNPKRGEAEIIIGKQRNGPIGMVKSHFNATYSSFLPYSPMEELPAEDESAVLSNI
ncbi:MAG: replicative DNA helicase [Deltaproteobacteria bacterium]|nr:replicative DNA helicase [Deltaproteobacteria bacterium]